MWLHQNPVFVKKYKSLFVDILEIKALVSSCIWFLQREGFQYIFLFAAECYLYFSSRVLFLPYYFFLAVALQSLLGYGKNSCKMIFVLLSFASSWFFWEWEALKILKPGSIKKDIK